jgi:hypothetical protein
MKTVFTICGNNYLPQALVLGASLARHNPHWRFYIILVDKKSTSIDYDGKGIYEVLEVESLGIPDFGRMAERYSIVELCTSVKAAAFQHLFRIHPEVTDVMYLDPDIKVYGDFRDILREAGDAQIALTPHVLSPIPLDGQFPQENLFLNHGTFNLGFLLLRRGEESQRFLVWWAERLREKAVIDLVEGYFTDQIWINLVPVYFKKVLILRSFGLNLAFWNLHERTVTADPRGGYRVNGRDPLVFVHFSSYSPLVPEQFISRREIRFRLAERPDVASLYREYRLDLLRAGYEEMRPQVPVYEVVRRRRLLEQQKERDARPARRILLALRAMVPEAFRANIRQCLKP